MAGKSRLFSIIPLFGCQSLSDKSGNFEFPNQKNKSFSCPFYGLSDQGKAETFPLTRLDSARLVRGRDIVLPHFEEKLFKIIKKASYISM